jgi:hypothetical protein
MHHLSERQSATLRAVAERIVTELAEAGPDAGSRFESIVGTALEARAAAVRRQLGTFLTVIRWAPVLRWGRRFEALPASHRDRFLRWLERHPVQTIRAGFWGLKTLVLMGWYGRHEHWDAISYRPSLEGEPRWHDPYGV